VSRLVVAPYRPWRRPLLVLLALCATGVLAYIAHTYGQATMAARHQAAESERRRLDRDNRRLSTENTTLRERVAVLERATDIDRKAYAELGAHLGRLERQIGDLEEEVAFYRGIVSSDESEPLNIRSFEVEPTEVEGEYVYRLVLTRHMKNDKVMTGLVEVSVIGERDGRDERLSLDRLGAGETGRAIEFRFRYFQRIEGRLALPAGFSPRRVSVRVIEADGGKSLAERNFEWPADDASDRVGHRNEGLRSRRLAG